MFKYICDLKYDWLRLNGVNVFVCYLYMYRMTTGRFEVRIFFLAKEKKEKNTEKVERNFCTVHCQLK